MQNDNLLEKGDLLFLTINIKNIIEDCAMIISKIYDLT